MLFPAGPFKQLHLDKASLHRGAANVITVRCEGRKYVVREAVVLGFSSFVYRPATPLMPEGTYAWVETTAAVQTLD